MKLNHFLIILGLALCFQTGYSQTDSNRLKLLISSRVDTTSTDVRDVVKLYEDYYNSKPDSIYNNPYWNKVEKEKYKAFDFSAEDIFQGNMTPEILFKYYSPFVMSVEPIGEKYQIRVLFSSPTTDSEQAGSKVWTIQKLNAIKEDGKWVLENLIVEITKNWSSKTFGNIIYHYPPEHNFDSKQAKKSEAFNQDIIKRFNPKYKDSFDFYITDNVDQMGLLENFDYYFVGITTGKVKGNMIWSAKRNEFYPHEFVHKLLPKNIKRGFVIEEGLAVFLGTKENQTEYQETLKKLAIDINENPEKFNFHSVISQQEPFNGYQTAYPAGAALCELVYNKKGDIGLSALIKSDTSDYEHIIQTVCEITQMKIEELQIAWKNILKKYNE